MVKQLETRDVPSSGPPLNPNVAPSFTPGQNVGILEDAGAVAISAWATNISPGPAEEAWQTVNFEVNTDNPDLFSVLPAIDTQTGDLTFTPVADANGLANLTVILHDNGGTENGGDDTSDPVYFTITVTPVNDAPSFTASTPPTVDQVPDVAFGFVFLPGWATFNPGGGPDEEGQMPSYIVSNVSNPELFNVLPAVDETGSLSYTVAANAYGTSTFEVTVQDDGGTANGGEDTSPAQMFTAVVAQTPPGGPILKAFTVNSLTDKADINEGDGVADSDPAPGIQTSLRSAIEEGNFGLTAGFVLITFQEGLNGTITVGTDTCIALPFFLNNYAIVGPGSTVITVDGFETFRVFHVTTGYSVFISGLEIANGNANLNSAGAIYNNGNLALTAMTFNNNQGSAGGAIYNNGRLAVFNSHFYYNTSTSGHGGAIYNAGQALINGSELYVNLSAFDGGAVYNASGAFLGLTGNTQIYSNTAQRNGGGIFNDGTLIFVNGLLQGNEAIRGGGLFSTGTSILSSVQIKNNTGTLQGGGIRVNGGKTTIIGCLLQGNTVGGNANGVSFKPNTFWRFNPLGPDPVIEEN